MNSVSNNLVSFDAVKFLGQMLKSISFIVCGLALVFSVQAYAGKTLTVTNKRDAFPIWKVYITPAGQRNWGTEQLGDKIIAANASHTWNISWSGCYVDVKAETFTGLSVDRRNVNVCGGFEWFIYDDNNNNHTVARSSQNKHVVCITNQLNGTFNYQYRWENDNTWTSVSLRENYHRWHANGVKQKFFIKFDEGYSKGYQGRQYHLKTFESQAQCDGAKKYDAYSTGFSYDLKPTN